MRRFLVITGLPGSGKSTLGKILSASLNLTLLDKDLILEGLFESRGSASRSELSRRADQLFEAAALSSDGGVLVSWWKHPMSAAASGTPMDWLSLLPGPAVEVFCACSPALALSRFSSRERHLGHEDRYRSMAALESQLFEQSSLGAANVAPVIMVNSEEPFVLQNILRDVKSAFAKCWGAEPPFSWRS